MVRYLRSVEFEIMNKNAILDKRLLCLVSIAASNGDEILSQAGLEFTFVVAPQLKLFESDWIEQMSNIIKISLGARSHLVFNVQMGLCLFLM